MENYFILLGLSFDPVESNEEVIKNAIEAKREQWQKEAKKRGLDTETSVPLMIDQYINKSSIQMFTSTGVLSQSELLSRCEVKWENYSMKLQIESRVLGDLVINHILPAAKRYQTILLQNVQGVKQVFSASEAEKLSEQDILLIRSIENHTSAITAKVNNMNKERARANHIDNQRERAITFHDYVVPLMEEIRQHVDDLEMVIDDQLWPLPKYRELLFIH